MVQQWILVPPVGGIVASPGQSHSSFLWQDRLMTGILISAGSADVWFFWHPSRLCVCAFMRHVFPHHFSLHCLCQPPHPPPFSSPSLLISFSPSLSLPNCCLCGWWCIMKSAAFSAWLKHKDIFSVPVTKLFTDSYPAANTMVQFAENGRHNEALAHFWGFAVFSGCSGECSHIHTSHKTFWIEGFF